MWIPDSAQAVLDRLALGDLEETATFDGKRGAPKNPDLAVDVAAMTVNGGVLLFGVAENEPGTRLTVPEPIELVGERERVEQMVTTGVSEPPPIQIRALPLSDDPARGFLAVLVMPSPRAPHQVTLRGKYEGRFYTRDATGNRILGQTEVELLYARRAKWERDVGELTRAAFDREIGEPRPDRVYLAAILEPVAASDDLLKASSLSVPPMLLRSAVDQAIRVGHWRMDLAGFADLITWTPRDADTWYARWPYDSDWPELLVLAERSGRVTAVCSRVGRPHERDPDQLLLYEQTLAAVTTRTIALCGQVTAHAGYPGPVDVGLMVAPLRGVRSALRSHPMYDDPGIAYGSADYIRTCRVPAGDLRDSPQDVARSLIADLIEALVGTGFDPFVEPK